MRFSIAPLTCSPVICGVRGRRERTTNESSALLWPRSRSPAFSLWQVSALPLHRTLAFSPCSPVWRAWGAQDRDQRNWTIGSPSVARARELARTGRQSGVRRAQRQPHLHNSHALARRSSCPDDTCVCCLALWIAETDGDVEVLSMAQPDAYGSRSTWYSSLLMTVRRAGVKVKSLSRLV